METDRRADEIARLAYDLWEAEGRPDGKADEHWHRASALLATTIEEDPEAPDAMDPPGAEIDPTPADVARDDEPVGAPDDQGLDDQETEGTPKGLEPGLEHDAVRSRGDVPSDALLDDALTGR